MSRKICPYCKSVTFDDPFCSKCASYVAPIFMHYNADDDRSVKKRQSVCDDCGSKIKPFMNFCPDCGEEIKWTKAIPANLECKECGSEITAQFNYCYACGWEVPKRVMLFPRKTKPVKFVKTFSLKHECDNDECDGLLGDYMYFCPWCGEEQAWEYGEYKCQACENLIDEDSSYCPFCGK